MSLAQEIEFIMNRIEAREGNVLSSDDRRVMGVFKDMEEAYNFACSMAVFDTVVEIRQGRKTSAGYVSVPLAQFNY